MPRSYDTSAYCFIQIPDPTLFERIKKHRDVNHRIAPNDTRQIRDLKEILTKLKLIVQLGI